MISVLSGFDEFGFLLVLEVGCGADVFDQTQIRTILSSETTSSSITVAADLIDLFSITRRRPRCIVPHAMPISPPYSPQLAADLSQSSCGCEIWDGVDGFKIYGCGQWCGAMDLVAILVKYYFNMWIYYFNV